MCCRKFRYDHFPGKLCCNQGWILDVVRWKFSILQVLSIGRIIAWCIKTKKSRKFAYIFTDFYVMFWVGLLIWLFLCQAHVGCGSAVLWLVAVVLVSYRLFEIFQSWVSQFILGGVPRPGWQPISKFRSLILVFIGYCEVVVAYAIFALIFNEHFTGINRWQDALYYSVRNAATIGSKFHPEDCVGYTLFITQIMFALLFLTAVVQSIVSYKEEQEEQME
jgi:hypothetical protein